MKYPIVRFLSRYFGDERCNFYLSLEDVVPSKTLKDPHCSMVYIRVVKYTIISRCRLYGQIGPFVEISKDNMKRETPKTGNSSYPLKIWSKN